VGEEISHYFQTVFFYTGTPILPRLLKSCGHRFFLAALTITSIIAATSAPAQSGKLSVAPPSSWVGPIRTVRTPAAQPADATAPLRWLLYERQINVKNDEQFFHLIRQVATRDGIQEASHIAIEYVPSYESLTLHWVRILRGTNALNRLDFSRIQTTQRSVDAARFVFGGEQPASLLIEGVQPGDLIDYAYSIQGSNPALRGMFCAKVPVQFDEPVDRFVTRLLWPPPRKFYVQNHGTDIYPATGYTNGLVEYIWTANAVPGLRGQSPMPSWFNPRPWVQLTEFQNWSAVNKWALGLLAPTNIPSSEFSQQTDEWKKLTRPEDGAAAALRFVQEQIRSVDSTENDSSNTLTVPSAILTRRFGNSTDKTRLLVAMLRDLNIEAYPMLVSAKLKRTISDLHPSADLFDHLVVEVTLNNQNYFLDPVGAYERGPINVRSWPNYGYGLSIRPETTALTVIPPCPVDSKTMVSEYFDVQGFDQETGVKIVTIADGADAKALREHFVMTPIEQIEREYLRAQEDFYPRIHSTSPIEFSDDQENNRFQVTSSYSIPGFWRRRPEEANFHCQFYSFNVDSAMQKPVDSIRSMPMALDFPVHQLFHVEANWRTGWPVRPDTQRIQNPAFIFNRTMNIVGTNLIADFEYRSLSDAVMPEAFPAYVRQLDTASQSLGCTVVSY
jgi:hypothetical protein